MNNDTIAMEWFRTDASYVLIAQGTTQERGLTAKEVYKRRERFGKNLLTIRGGKGPLVRFLLQFHRNNRDRRWIASATSLSGSRSRYIVVLASGDKVPADIRLLPVKEMRIAEAALTVRREKETQLIFSQGLLFWASART